MTLLDELATFITGVAFDRFSPATIEPIEVHLFDSLGALIAGIKTNELKVHFELMKGLSRDDTRARSPGVHAFLSAPLPQALFLTCVTTRLTEVDDIDLLSCTTPSSIVVPTALCLASSNSVSGRRFYESLAVGYDVITRLGAAVDGPEILYRGVWPTYLCGPIGSAAVCSKLLGLTLEKTREALAIALTLTSGLAGRIKSGLTSRWLTLGWSVQSGLSAALAAAQGFCGDSTLLDGLFPSVLGLRLDSGFLLKGLGQEFKVEKIALKPFCTARQALASVEAFQTLLSQHRFDPEGIEGIDVEVPEQYRQMIDRAAFPDDRLSSITSLQYQMAMAAFYSEDLFDIHRDILRDEQRVHRLMQKIRIRPSPKFTAMFPQRWPGKVSVQVAGQSLEQEVLIPRGDPVRPLTWQELEQKVGFISKGHLGTADAANLGAWVRRVKEAKDFAELLPSLFEITG
jgi:2-methylcitrate dehydratase PrpD